MSVFLDLIFPKTCFGCKKIGRYFCQNCLDEQNTLAIETRDKNIEGRLSIFSYKKMVKNAIRELKYNFTTDLIGELSKICSNKIKTDYPNLLKYWQDNSFVMVPIPLHPYRQNWRSFNQSAILAKKIAFSLKLKYRDDFLKRNKYTESQAKFRNKSSRIKNISDVFCLDPNIKNIPKKIILFDDVYTTGSTLNSALKLFKIDDQNCHWFLAVAG
ncbi:MAG: hypothetical protein WCG91_01395 [Candidatus Shapirobacteria bacterium]